MADASTSSHINGDEHSDGSSTDHDEERFDQVMSLKAPELKPWMQKWSSEESSFEKVAQDVETGARGSGRPQRAAVRNDTAVCIYGALGLGSRSIGLTRHNPVHYRFFSFDRKIPWRRQELERDDGNGWKRA